MKKCDLCDFETDNRERYAGHRSAHVRRGELEKRPSPKAEHVCKFCDRKFDTGPALGAHIRIHVSNEELLARFSMKKCRQRHAALKSLLLRLGREYKCELCGLGPTWSDKPLTLQVDHVDGNNVNNSEMNLRFLCPNCHTQTPTYANKKRNQRHGEMAP